MGKADKIGIDYGDGVWKMGGQGGHACEDLDTNALLRIDDSPDTNAFGALLCGFEYAVPLTASSLTSPSVTAGKKHGVDDRLDQNEVF